MRVRSGVGVATAEAYRRQVEVEVHVRRIQKPLSRIDAWVPILGSYQVI